MKRGAIHLALLVIVLVGAGITLQTVGRAQGVTPPPAWISLDNIRVLISIEPHSVDGNNNGVVDRCETMTYDPASVSGPYVLGASSPSHSISEVSVTAEEFIPVDDNENGFFDVGEIIDQGQGVDQGGQIIQGNWFHTFLDIAGGLTGTDAVNTHVDDLGWPDRCDCILEERDTDPRNCGDCGIVCPFWAPICDGGECREAAPAEPVPQDNGPVCGDQIIEGAEVCDPPGRGWAGPGGDSNGCPPNQVCADDCSSCGNTILLCGDGVVTFPEECEGPGRVAGGVNRFGESYPNLNAYGDTCPFAACGNDCRCLLLPPGGYYDPTGNPGPGNDWIPPPQPGVPWPDPPGSPGQPAGEAECGDGAWSWGEQCDPSAQPPGDNGHCAYYQECTQDCVCSNRFPAYEQAAIDPTFGTYPPAPAGSNLEGEYLTGNIPNYGWNWPSPIEPPIATPECGDGFWKTGTPEECDASAPGGTVPCGDGNACLADCTCEGGVIIGPPGG